MSADTKNVHGTPRREDPTLDVDGGRRRDDARRTARRRAVVAAVVAVAIATGSVLVLAGTSRDAGGDPATTRPAATSTVQRRDLVERETVSGTLGFDDAETFTSSRTGTVTWLPAQGRIVRRGQALLRIDDRPVILLYGEVPAFRTMSAGVRGTDMRQLQRNLRALGYDVDVTGMFDAETIGAVGDWQDDRGWDETGAIALGDVAFLPGPRRVGAATATVGSAAGPGAQLFTTSDTEQIVTLRLTADQRELVERGSRVAVELPDGSGVTARVERVAESATVGEDPTADPTFEVIVSLRTRADGGAFDGATVDVDLESDRAADVLAVPVTALLALAEGGYGVEVVRPDGTTELVAVTDGAYADGWVEVEGAGIDEGVEVVTAP